MMEWFNVGKIVNTHGIAGEVRVISTTDFPKERFCKGNDLYLFFEKSEQPIKLTIRSMRQHKNFYLLIFENYSSISLVEKFKGCTLKIPKAQQTQLPINEFYYHEIIGCQVFSESGEELGTITEILSPGANDVWIVKMLDSKEVYIPYIADVVKKVDVSNKQVVIHVLEGLLDL